MDEPKPAYGSATVMVATLVLLLLIPPAVFVLTALASDLSAGESLRALLDQYRAARTNLAVCSLLGLFPWLLLSLFLGVRRFLRRSSADSALYALVASLPMVLVAVFVHVGYWRTFLPNKTYAGFPHGLEFIIGPGVFAPAGMLLAIAVAWWTLRLQRRNVTD